MADTTPPRRPMPVRRSDRVVGAAATAVAMAGAAAEWLCTTADAAAIQAWWVRRRAGWRAMSAGHEHPER